MPISRHEREREVGRRRWILVFVCYMGFLHQGDPVLVLGHGHGVVTDLGPIELGDQLVDEVAALVHFDPQLLVLEPAKVRSESARSARDEALENRDDARGRGRPAMSGAPARRGRAL